jgi:hypothetical protein
MLTRLNSSGASDNIDVFDWTSGWYDMIAFGPVDMITNADQGVVLSWAAPGTMLGMAVTTGTSVSLINAPEVPGQDVLLPIAPVLQEQDGSFVGTAVVGYDANNNPLTSMVSFDQTGNVRWTVPGNYQPQIATADGGLIATDPSGAAITFDQNGNVTGQMASLPIPSWTGVAYRLGSVDQVVSLPISVATTLWDFQAANESANGTAAQQGFTLKGPTSVKTTYSGTQLLDCYGRPANPPQPVWYGYQECESYTVWDKGSPPKQIVRAGITFNEDVKLVASSTGGADYTSSGYTDNNGVLKDLLGSGSPISAPPPGSYTLYRQTISLASTGITVRVNCIDFEATDVTVTDITSTPGTQCARN